MGMEINGLGIVDAEPREISCRTAVCVRCGGRFRGSAADSRNDRGAGWHVVICVLLDMAGRLPAAIVISSGGTCGYGDKGIRLY